MLSSDGVAMDDLVDTIEEVLVYHHVVSDLQELRDYPFCLPDKTGDIEFMRENLRKWKGRINGEA